MSSTDDAFLRALDDHIRGMLGDGVANSPGSRQYLGTWAAAESSDANLSQVILQGGQWVRYVPKLSHVTGLSAGKIVKLEVSPTMPLHITGILVGNIKNASLSLTDTQPPTAPTSLAVTVVTTSSVSLSWTASTDNVAVVAYDVFVGGVYNQSVIGTTATVSNLAANTTYAFTVRARDAANNVSGLSNQVSGTTSAGSAPPTGTTYTKQYSPTWSRTFNYNGSNEYDSWLTSCYQGQYDGGNLKSLIGFNSSQIVSDLAGGTPVDAQIRLTYAHWYYNNGGTAVIGTHTNSSAPSTFTGATTNRWQSAGWPVGGTRWVDLGSAVCGEFAAGTTKGICLGPGPSSSVTYYGYAYGAGSGVYAPILQLTFTR